MKIYESVTVGQVLERGASQVPDKIAVIDGSSRKTYSELNSMANALAVSLAEIGLEKGDRIAIYAPNSIEFMVAFYAMQKLGVIVAWVNPIYRKKEAQFILHNSEARAVFIFSEWDGRNYTDDILNLRNELPNLEFIFVVGENISQGVYSFYDLINKGMEKTFASVAIDPKNDLSMLLYTSGTTGPCISCRTKLYDCILFRNLPNRVVFRS
jgi:acyl-CoA synthetase (AMP-forming)/AMP-acid ligase II